MSGYQVPNRILFADAYTLASFDLVSPAMRARAAYHLGLAWSAVRKWMSAASPSTSSRSAARLR